MIEEELVEALAQEHFNYIAEGGGVPTGIHLGASSSTSSPTSSPTTRSRMQEWLLRSPKVAVHLLAAVATVMLARHLKGFLVDFTKEAFSVEGGDDGGRRSAGSYVQR